MFDSNCIFCKIAKKEIPAKIVYEDDNSIAFLDINPFGKGHTIVIPKNHYPNLLEFDEKEFPGFFSTLKKVAALLKEKLRADGINILQNNFKAAGQVINHVHFHVIPRWENDNFPKFKPPERKPSDKELEQILNEILS